MNLSTLSASVYNQYTLYIYIYTYTHTHTHTHIYTHIHTHIHTYIHVYVLYIYTYIYIYTHTHINIIVCFFGYFSDRASQYICLNINQLDALNFIMRLFSCLYMFRAQVLIVRRPELNYTVSGIITPIGVMIPETV